MEAFQKALLFIDNCTRLMKMGFRPKPLRKASVLRVTASPPLLLSVIVFIKCMPIKFQSGDTFAYVAIDYDAQTSARRSDNKKPTSKFASDSARDEKLMNIGVFVLISKVKVEKSEILSLYYSRQAIEQTFDFEKNYANLLPMRTHREDTFRRHLLISFLATASIKAIDKMFMVAHPMA